MPTPPATTAPAASVPAAPASASPTESGYQRVSIAGLALTIEVPDGYRRLDWSSLNGLPGAMFTPGGIKPTGVAGVTTGVAVAMIGSIGPDDPQAALSDEALLETLVATLGADTAATLVALPAGPGVRFEQDVMSPASLAPSGCPGSPDCPAPSTPAVEAQVVNHVFLARMTLECRPTVVIYAVSHTVPRQDAGSRAVATAIAKSVEILPPDDGCSSPSSSPRAGG
jgi:hypothetical protein